MRKLNEYIKIQRSLATLIRNRKIFINSHKLAHCNYANLGCGPQLLPEFINVDHYWRPGVDICWDMTRGLPLRSDSLRGIFSEHCIEHFTFEELLKWLMECRRVLKPGGIIRLITPDLEQFIDAYTRKRKDPKSRYFPYEETVCWNNIRTRAIHINRIFYQGHLNMRKQRFFHSGHHSILDFETLSAFLLKAGFTSIVRSSFMEGTDQRLVIDTPSRQEESLYVEAQNPT